jgi:hypothetical protein
LTQILISKKFEKEIVFESCVLAWIQNRIRIEQKCWIRIRKKSIRIDNPAKSKTSDSLAIVKGSLNRAFCVKYHQKYQNFLELAGNLILTRRELVNDTYRAMNETANTIPYLLNFKMK